MVSHYALQNGFELVILLPQFPNCRAYRGLLSHPVFVDCVCPFVISPDVGKTKRGGLWSAGTLTAVDAVAQGDLVQIFESVSHILVWKSSLASQPENAPKLTSQ